MRRFAATVAFALMLSGSGGAAPAAQPVRLALAYRSGEAASVLALERGLGLRLVARMPQLRVDVLEVDPAGELDALAVLRADPLVRWAQADSRVHALRVPDDPLWPSQWSPVTTHAPAAWDRTVGAPVVVAMVDTGVDATHPDLQDRVVAGHDFVNDDADPADDNGHGTGVAGIVGAAGDNGIGVAGYCWACRLMPVKVLGADGDGFSTTVAEGVVWAVDHGARVINASLGGPVDDLTLAAAAAYAWAHGVLVVAAAGNDSSSLLGYPAALPNVVSVGASTASDELYDFSNTGAALAAPGENSTTSLGGGYERFLGTSSAAPVVSGIAGLLLGLAPGATPAQLTRALEQSAVPMAGAVYGRVDAQGALNALVPAHPAAPAPPAQPPAPQAGRSTRPASRTVARTLTGRLGRSGRTYSVATARGRLVVRVSLVGKRAAVVRVTVSHGRHRLATRAGRRSVRLGVAVRAGRYRIVVSGPKGRAFRLSLSYPRP